MINTTGIGKGDKWRENFDYSKYWDNWDNIKPNNKIKRKPKKLKRGVIRYTY